MSLMRKANAPLKGNYTLDPTKPDCVLASVPVSAPRPLAALASRSSIRPALRNLRRLPSVSFGSDPTVVDPELGTHVTSIDDQAVTEPMKEERFDLSPLHPDVLVGGHDSCDFDRSASPPRFEGSFEFRPETESEMVEADEMTVTLFRPSLAPKAGPFFPSETTERTDLDPASRPRLGSRAMSFAFGVILASVALLLDALILAGSGFEALIQLVIAGGVGLVIAGVLLLRNAKRQQHVVERPTHQQIQTATF